MRALYARRWADLPLRGKALVVISLPLVVLLLSLVLIYITERQTVRAEEDVRRVLRVQGDIRAVHTLLAEAAASVRGYLLTRREDFLPGYLNAKPQIEAALLRLDRNVRDQRVREQLTQIEGARTAHADCAADQQQNRWVGRHAQGPDDEHCVDHHHSGE
jgi:CHASE3 domain sensor protein